MEKKTRTNAVYITCLPDDVTEDKITEVFGAIGMIKTSKKTGGPSVTLYNDKRTDKFKVRLKSMCVHVHCMHTNPPHTAPDTCTHTHTHTYLTCTCIYHTLSFLPLCTG